MAQQKLNNGLDSTPTTGESFTSLMSKCNSNFSELYAGSGGISFVSGIVTDGTTDNSTIIQAAINAVVSAGGGIVRLPSGVIAVATPLVINGDGVILEGEGMLGTTLKAIGNGTRVLRVGSLSTSTSGKSTDCQIRDCGFEGTVASTVEVVEILGVTRLIVSNCKFFQGNNALSVRNADQSAFYNNIIRVNQSSKTALRLIQGELDDVTTCGFFGGVIEVTSTNSVCVRFVGASGASTNEFNNIVFGDALKFDGNNLAGNTGIVAEAGVRNVTFRNIEMKDFRGYSFDMASSLIDGQKVFFSIDSCKLLGNSASPTLAHISIKRSATSGSDGRVNITNTQMHRAVSGVLSALGKPTVITEALDLSSLTNGFEVVTGAFMNLARGNASVGGSVTNLIGTLLQATITATTSTQTLRDTIF